MGCEIDRAYPATVTIEDWGIDDPTGKQLDEVKRIRDQIELKVMSLLQDQTG